MQLTPNPACEAKKWMSLRDWWVEPPKKGQVCGAERTHPLCSMERARIIPPSSPCQTDDLHAELDPQSAAHTTPHPPPPGTAGTGGAARLMPGRPVFHLLLSTSRALRLPACITAPVRIAPLSLFVFICCDFSLDVFSLAGLKIEITQRAVCTGSGQRQPGHVTTAPMYRTFCMHSWCSTLPSVSL